MALFFDQDWFDEKLIDAGLKRGDLARGLGLTELELAEMWKDQREISVAEIKTLALLLNAPEAEVKKRGGLQGSPNARAMSDDQRTGAPTQQREVRADERLDRIEALLEEVLKELKDRR